MQKLLGSHQKTPARKGTEVSGENPVDTAIASFERARAELAHFRQEHADVLDQYAQLQSDVEACCDEVKAQYMQHKEDLGASYGGFKIIAKRSVDANKLVDINPDAIAVVKFTLTVGELDELVASGALDEEVANKVTVTKESIVGPKI